MVETITTEELEEKFGNDEDFILVDVLGEEYFEKGHIPGAVNIPFGRIAKTALQEMEKDDDIVVYCKNTKCSASPKAAEKLEDLGFENVKDYEAGIEGWKDAGNDVEV